MKETLLEQLKEALKEAKNTAKSRLNVNSSFVTLTEKEITEVLALRAKSLRIAYGKKQRNLCDDANLGSISTYANFEQNGTITLENFVKVIRALGRLEELEALLRPTVKEQIQETKLGQILKKRVR